MITNDVYFVNPADFTIYGDVLGVILFSKKFKSLNLIRKNLLNDAISCLVNDALVVKSSEFFSIL